MSPFRAPIDKILLKPNIPAGMDSETVISLIKRLRTSNEDWDPVLVSAEGEYWRLEDGRHRFFASVIAGRPDVLAIEDTGANDAGSP